MGNYTSKSLSYDTEKEEKGKIKLTHEIICKESEKEKRVMPIVFVSLTILLALVISVLVLSIDNFGIVINIFLYLSIAYLLFLYFHSIYRIISTKLAIKNKEYTIITDTIASIEEKTALGVVGFGSTRRIGFKTKYYANMSLLNRKEVDIKFAETHSSGETFHLVVCNKRPKEIVFWFSDKAYELVDSENHRSDEKEV